MPRRWRGDSSRIDNATSRGRPERVRPPRRPRPFDAERAGGPQGEILARLDRLESLVAAIAAHLRIEPAGFPRGRGARGGQHHGSAVPSASAEDHAVVRTLARRLSGRLKVYHAERGYGFVVSPDVPGDVFFHRSDARVDPAALEPSAPVTFDLVEMANGQSKAVNVVAKS